MQGLLILSFGDEIGGGLDGVLQMVSQLAKKSSPGMQMGASQDNALSALNSSRGGAGMTPHPNSTPQMYDRSQGQFPFNPSNIGAGTMTASSVRPPMGGPAHAAGAPQVSRLMPFGGQVIKKKKPNLDDEFMSMIASSGGNKLL